jgi:hypothetical protein
MSQRMNEWMQAEYKLVKSYEQRRAENPVTSTTDYNEKILKPDQEQNRLENELRKKLGAPPDWASDAEKIEFHRRQLALLEKANHAPRCGHIYSDGTQCRGPKLRNDKVCYAHARMLAVRPRRLNLPPLEDANAVMLWLMEVSRALLEGEITERTAGLLFYGLQMAMATARWTTFAQTKPEEMVRRMQKDFTAKDAKNAKRDGEAERQNLPRRHGDTEESGELTTEDTEEQRGTGASANSITISPENQRMIAGDESDKSLFFGDEMGGGGDESRRPPESEKPTTEARRHEGIG